MGWFWFLGFGCGLDFDLYGPRLFLMRKPCQKMGFGFFVLMMRDLRKIPTPDLPPDGMRHEPKRHKLGNFCGMPDAAI
jgi:hypothetical protein